MHLVDTSIWIHALRPNGNPDIRARLRPLILSGNTAVTEWILLELMTGLTKSEQPSDLLQWFAPVSKLPFLDEWWEKAWHYAGRLRKQGVSPSAADCYIATIAIEHRVALIHCDADFELMSTAIPLRTLDWTDSLRKS
jgi:predicted nucleic acid-binding protein